MLIDLTATYIKPKGVTTKSDLDVGTVTEYEYEGPEVNFKPKIKPKTTHGKKKNKFLPTFTGKYNII